MIEIGSTTDTDFVDVLLTSYVSLLINNADEDFSFNIIDDQLTRKDRARLNSLVKIYSNCQKVTFLGNSFAQLYQGTNTTSPRSVIKENTYYRFELPHLVNCPRLLYLDCDMICRGKIGQLFRSNLHGCPLGAVESQMYVDRLSILGVRHHSPRYFNAGLLLIDVQKWNEQEVTQKARQFTHDNRKILDFQDQDVLNAVLADNWALLDPKYDVQSPLMRHESCSSDPHQAQLADQALVDPTLIHYTGFSKPWVTSGKYVSPWREEYYHYHKIMIAQIDRR